MTEYTLKEGDTILIPNRGEPAYLFKRVSLDEIRDLVVPEQKITVNDMMHVIS